MKTFKKIFFLALVLVTLGDLAHAQQDPQYSQYMFNGLTLNPAYAGSRDAISGVMLLRKQWLGIEGSPATGSIALHGPSRNLRHGFGFSFTHDRIGITQQNFLNAAYAFRIPVGTGKLALALQGGFTHYRNAFSQLTTIDADGSLPQNNQAAVLPRVGTGAFLSFERFYVGISAPNIIAGRYFRYKNNTAKDLAAQQKVHYFATAGVVVPIGNNLDFRPSTVVKYVNNAPVEADLNAALFINKMFWVGAGYRTGDAMIFMFEYFHKNGLRLGYSYDLTLTRLNRVNSGSHELMVGFDLGLGKSKIITPRYF